MQDAAILTLSVEVLLRICSHLGAMDLLRLGHTCRTLRAVCRDPHAWSHVTWASTGHGYYRCHRTGNVGILKVAPALRAIYLDEDELNAPRVNLLRCTRLVREFHLEWEEYTQESYDVDRVIPLLRHYRGSLDVSTSTICFRATFGTVSDTSMRRARSVTHTSTGSRNETISRSAFLRYTISDCSTAMR